MLAAKIVLHDVALHPIGVPRPTCSRWERVSHVSDKTYSLERKWPSFPWPRTCWQHQTCKKLFISKLNSLLQAQSPSLGRRPQITIVAVELKERTVSMRFRKSLLTVSISTNCFGIMGLRYRILYPTIPNLQCTAPSLSLVPSKNAIVSKPPILIFPWRISRFMELYVLPGLGIILQLLMALLSKCLSKDEDKTNFWGPAKGRSLWARFAYTKRASGEGLCRAPGHHRAKTLI